MILIINICKEKLHYLEFVKPIEDILKNNKIDFFTKHFKELQENDIKKSSKVIICGTSLYDNEFMKYLNEFKWILTYEKPILGICAGMQIIGILYSGKIKKKIEIGFYKEYFKKEFLGFKGEQEVYHLHNYYIYGIKNFIIYSGNDIPQAIKHKTKQFYGVLFHPEVREKHLIKNFCFL